MKDINNAVEKLLADQDIIIKAVKLIMEAMSENEIPQLEGAIAMKSILNTMAQNGMDLRSEPANLI